MLVILAVFAPLLSPHDPKAQNLRDARTAPFQTWEYPLGTDFVGKDILSRLIYGARTSAFISMFALGAGVVVGTVLGLISGYAGKWVDTIIMRIADATMGFPSILLAMIIVAILGTGLMPIVVAVAVSTWPRIARMIRGEVLSVKDSDFVILARIAGVSPTVIIWRHVFPNVLNTLMVITSLSVAGVISDGGVAELSWVWACRRATRRGESWLPRADRVLSGCGGYRCSPALSLR